LHLVGILFPRVVYMFGVHSHLSQNNGHKGCMKTPCWRSDNGHTTHTYVRSGESYTPIIGASTIPPLHQKKTSASME